MSGIFQRLFGRRAATGSDSPAVPKGEPTTGVASALESGDEVQREYEEFRKTFQFKPGQRLMNYLSVHHIDQLHDWFHPGTQEPEPKSFIRLANDATRNGVKIWQQTGVQMYLHGRWSQGGGPSQRSCDCLSVLAQVFQMPITVYLRPAEDAATMSLTFDP